MAKDDFIKSLRDEVVKDVQKLARTVMALQQNNKATESEKAAIMALEPILSDLVKAVAFA